jgi:hypothetical protein
MTKATLTESEMADINAQAQSDASAGQTTRYQGSTLTDVVFGVVDFAAGSPSTSERAAAKNSFYEKCRDAKDE